MAKFRGSAASSQHCPESLRALVLELVEALVESGAPPSEFRGVALYDDAKDALIAAQASFGRAVDELAALPVVVARCGSDEAPRLVKQFCFECTQRWSDVKGVPVDEVWRHLIEELNDPDWHYAVVANLRNVRLASGPEPSSVNGIRVAYRSFDELRMLGFDEHSLEGLADEANDHGASPLVVLGQSTKPKSPETFLGKYDPDLEVSCWRMLGALRLLGQGEVSMGRIWSARRTRFRIGSGTIITGWPAPASMWGEAYELTPDIERCLPDLFQALADLEAAGYEAGPGNLRIALLSFMSSYDRFPSLPESQLIDLITALEAVLGSKTETTFRLAFRVAGLIGDDPAHRVQVFREVKDFYNARSRLVHGDALKAKEVAALERVHVLKDYVRRLLKGFVLHAATAPPARSRQYFQDALDEDLLCDETRERLRLDLRLSRPPM